MRLITSNGKGLSYYSLLSKEQLKKSISWKALATHVAASDVQEKNIDTIVVDGLMEMRMCITAVSGETKIFIPLLSLVQDLPSNSGAFTKSKQMIYFVAFQNGFFWKDFLDKKRKLQPIPHNDT